MSLPRIDLGFLQLPDSRSGELQISSRPDIEPTEPTEGTNSAFRRQRDRRAERGPAAPKPGAAPYKGVSQQLRSSRPPRQGLIVIAKWILVEISRECRDTGHMFLMKHDPVHQTLKKSNAFKK